MNTDPVEYYRQRALEYEAIYQKPERQGDLYAAEISLQERFAGLDVLEIACGTGYWTEKIAQTARSICAGDINEAVLTIARTKACPCPVNFRQEDFYQLPPHGEGPGFDALFGGFIWSHIPRQKLSDVLGDLQKRIVPGGRLVFIDNRFVESSSTPIHSRDDAGNTYQQRRLGDGTEHMVLKNFPSPDEIRRLLSPFGTTEMLELTYFWLADCRLFSNKR